MGFFAFSHGWTWAWWGLARCIDPRRIAVRWWTLAVLFYPVLTLLAVVITNRTGLGGTIDLAGTGQRLLEPIGFFFFALFLLLMGPLPEEIGWRGYLLDRLLVRRSALGASLTVALVWWIWHLPLGYLPGYFAAFEGNPRPAWHQLLYCLLVPPRSRNGVADVESKQFFPRRRYDPPSARRTEIGRNRLGIRK